MTGLRKKRAKQPSQKQLDNWAKQSREKKGVPRSRGEFAGGEQGKDFHRMVRQGTQALFVAIAHYHPDRVPPMYRTPQKELIG